MNIKSSLCIVLGDSKIQYDLYDKKLLFPFLVKDKHVVIILKLYPTIPISTLGGFQFSSI